MLVVVLDHLVRVHDDRDEEGEDHVDEEADETVKVDPAEHPNQDRLMHGDRVEGGEHVVPVDQAEQALAGGHKGGELEVVGAEDDPAGQDKAKVDEEGAEQEAKHIRSSTLDCEDEHIVGLEEAEEAEKSAPGEERPDP